MSQDSVSLGVRLPEQVKQQLVFHAQRNDRSLNAEIAVRLEMSLALDQTISRLFGAIDLGKAVRVRSGNTGQDVANLVALMGHLRVDRLILAAKAHDLNDAVLVVIMETPAATFLLDGTWLNMGRRTRELEIRELCQAMDRFGLLRTAEYCPDLVPDTAELEPEEALQVIAREGKPRKLEDLSDFLRTLSRHGIFDPADFVAGQPQA